MVREPTLHMICGKIAAGKSTLASRLAGESGGVLIAEDDWLAALFGDQMTTIADYVRCAETLRGIMAPHVVALLRAGVSVVLDFPANTVETRRWMRGIVDEAGVAHVLHVLDVSEETCMARLAARNARGEHPFKVTEAQFHRISSHYAPPSVEEGFTLERHPHP
ncbi:MAG: ATP-binding protein [Roseovarius sp.]